MNLKSINQIEDPIDLLTDIDLNEKAVISNQMKLIIAIAAITIMLLNLYLAYKTAPRFPKNYTNNKPDMTGAYVGIFFVLPISAFILSLLVSLIPIKKMKYSKKYLPFALVILVILQAGLFILLLRMI